MVGGEEVMDPLERWQARLEADLAEQRFQRALRRARRRVLREERLRPYREIAAALRQLLDEERGQLASEKASPD